MMDPEQLEAFRRLLLQRREDIAGLRDLSREETATVVLDQQSVGRLSRMDALQRQAMGAEQARRRDHELARIDGALTRISDGEYGACVECGEGIATGRLNADPAAATCVQCAKAAG